MRTASSVALPVVSGRTRSALTELSRLTAAVARSGRWTTSGRRMFAILAEHVLSDLDSEPLKENAHGIPPEGPIFPTPESEESEA